MVNFVPLGGSGQTRVAAQRPRDPQRGVDQLLRGIEDAATVAQEAQQRQALVRALVGTGQQVPAGAPQPAAGTPTVARPGGVQTGQAGLVPQGQRALIEALVGTPAGQEALVGRAVDQAMPQQLSPAQEAQLELERKRVQQGSRGLDLQAQNLEQERVLAERRLAINAFQTAEKGDREDASAEDALAGRLAESVAEEVQIIDAHRRAQASRIGQPNRVSDANLARNLAKAQRPDINVDEIDPGAFEQVFGRRLTAIVYGGEQFTEQERATAFGQLDRLASDAAATIQMRRQQVATTAQRRNLDPRSAAPDLSGGFQVPDREAQSGGLPDGVPPGSRPIGRNAEGSPMFESPDGRRLVVE